MGGRNKVLSDRRSCAVHGGTAPASDGSAILAEINHAEETRMSGSGLVLGRISLHDMQAPWEETDVGFEARDRKPHSSQP